MRYENEICQGCGKIMHEGEDIVVCPECGTPQHRECYNAENRCVNTHLHEDGYVWRPKHTEETAENSAPANAEVEKILCPFCQHQNPADAKECENCGQPFELFGKSILPSGKKNYGGSDDDFQYAYKPPFKVDEPEVSENAYRAPVGSGNESNFYFNGHQLKGEIDGTENKDMVLYLRTAVPGYHEKFRKIQNGKRTFNWAAFFFMPYWFFYRKLVKPGIIFVSLTLLLSVLFYNPMSEYMDIMAQAASQTAAAAESGQDSEGAAAVDALLEKTEELMPAIMAYAGLTMLLRIIAGIIADKMYMKKAVSDIREINGSLADSMNEQQDKYLAYTKKGGTSIGYTVLAYGAEYMISMVISGILTGMF